MNSKGISQGNQAIKPMMRYWELSNARIYEGAFVQEDKRCKYVTFLRTTVDQNPTYSLIG
jgi:hypothetical protein